MENDTRAAKITRMLDAALKSTQDWIAAGNEDHGEAEELERILDESLADFAGGLTSSAAQTYVQETGRLIEYDKWSPRIGVDLDVLRWRLLDYDGKNYNHRDECHWHDWPDDRVI